jgi:tripeptide aminopeptidase
MTNSSLPEPDLSRAFELVMQLMAIPGKSGEERLVAEAIVDLLRKAGVPDEWIAFDNAHQRALIPGNVGNLIVKLPGTQRGPRRLLTAHMDTVPICVGAQPVREGEVVLSANPQTGLGADNRAGCVVLLNAALEILQRKLPHPPLTLCWFIQEEVGLQGSRNLRKTLLGNPKLAFNWDGGPATRLTVGATGGYRMKIDVSGVASHAGVAPERGVSAIAIASLAIADLHRGGWHGDVNKGRKHGTSNVGFITGGEATNVVTDRVTLKAEARSHDPKFRQRIIREIERCFERASKEVRNSLGQRGAVQIDGRLDYESFQLTPAEPCVVAADRAIRAIGGEPYQAVTNGGLDSNWLASHGFPSVTLGCGQMNLHMTSERLDIAQFELACRIGLVLATAAEV